MKRQNALPPSLSLPTPLIPPQLPAQIYTTIVKVTCQLSINAQKVRFRLLFSDFNFSETSIKKILCLTQIPNAPLGARTAHFQKIPFSFLV